MTIDKITILRLCVICIFDKKDRVYFIKKINIFHVMVIVRKTVLPSLETILCTFNKGTSRKTPQGCFQQATPLGCFQKDTLGMFSAKDTPGVLQAKRPWD